MHIDKTNWLKDTFAKSLSFQDIIRQPLASYPALSDKEKDDLRQTQIFTDEIVQVLGQCDGHTLVRKYDRTLGWVPSTSLRHERECKSFAYPQGKTQSPEEFLSAWKGRPYVFGGISPEGIDCSGFTQLFYLNVLGARLPKNSFDQRKLGTSVSFDELQDHDLVFCRPLKKLEFHHVALYYDGRFWHSRRAGGVICQTKEEFEQEQKIEEVRRLRYRIFGTFVGPITTLANGEKSSIRRTPAAVLHIRKESIDHDTVANIKYHGGDMRVVHHYSNQNYDHLRSKFPEISDRFVPGTYGENILTNELSETDLFIGDIYKLGSATVQLTVPRRPCATINSSYEDNRILKEVMTSGKVGWFYRVLEEGEVRVGDYLEFVERPFPNLPATRLYDQGYGTARFKNFSFLSECLETGLMDKGWKPKIENALRNLIS